MIMRHGTRPEELDQLSRVFSKLDFFNTGGTRRARFTRQGESQATLKSAFEHKTLCEV